MMYEFEKAFGIMIRRSLLTIGTGQSNQTAIFTDEYVGEFDENGTITSGHLNNFPVTTIDQVSQNYTDYLDWRTDPLPMDSESPIRVSRSFPIRMNLSGALFPMLFHHPAPRIKWQLVSTQNFTNIIGAASSFLSKAKRPVAMERLQRMNRIFTGRFTCGLLVNSCSMKPPLLCWMAVI